MKSENFGELLIEALEEAVAYKQGKQPGVRVNHHKITAHGSHVEPRGEVRPRKKRG
jgi:hypothetical protein